MRKNIWVHFLQALLIGTCYVYLILCPKAASAAAVSGLKLCGQVIVPSLFPFFVCADLFCALGLTARLERPLSRVMEPVFGVPGSGAAALVLGLTGGYPSGAQAVSRLYADGRIDRKTAQKLLTFCNNCGPAFIFGVMGWSVFESTLAGLLLYLVHISSALLLGVFLKGRQAGRSAAVRRAEASPEPVSFSVAFTKSVLQAGKTALTVCMFVIVFAVLSAMLNGVLTHLLPARAAAILTGVLELSGGAAALAQASFSQGAKFVLSSMLLAFGGLSVHAQTKAVLEQAGLSGLRVFLPKALHAALAGLISVPVYALFRAQLEAAPAFAAERGWLLPAAAQAVLGAAACIGFRKMAGSNLRRHRV